MRRSLSTAKTTVLLAYELNGTNGLRYWRRLDDSLVVSFGSVYICVTLQAKKRWMKGGPQPDGGHPIMIEPARERVIEQTANTVLAERSSALVLHEAQ